MGEKLLSDKVAIVTGGARGIGRSIVKTLCKAGAVCVFSYRKSHDLAEALSIEIGAGGGETLFFEYDVRDFEGAKGLIEKTREKFGRVDILINNAGITRDRTLMMMGREDWVSVIDTDLTGVFNTTRACIVTFLKQRSGNIVNISSVSGIKPVAGQVNYAAAKAGVIGFTKALAKEVAPYNIRVNAVAPGFIDTDMTAEMSDKYKEGLIKGIPVGRFGRTDEVARAVLFLVSDEAGYITGQTIQIDGGLGI
ncbi:3-oxoacyl-[acyl-carrier-protein] reductase FabG [bacterium BMS3Bbin06]|nr:3-oxoacyl-[acyl-carrier-protein] reductase FabG [bacterium BMS3Abin08]GBE35103.1 3-oxoacyl-[acyl-carrier-protein] reductase FabG [bacterium BMS3Bbin06]HDY71207.1 3-oxoacyl-[acyl-carrier-protein] reductase [Nitrospirota bacterium]